MNTNRNRFRILLAAAAIIILGFYGRSLYEQYSSGASKPVFANVKLSEIDKIIIEDGEKQEIKRQNNNWVIKKGDSEFAADQERVESLLKELTTFTKGDIVSVNKSNHENLGIGKKAVTFADGKKDQTVYIGIPNANGINVRLGGANEAFIAHGLSDPFFPEDYRNLRVPLIADNKKTDKIEKITLSHGSTNFSLEKSGKDWKIGGNAAKNDRVDYFIGDLNTLKATDIKKSDKNPSAKAEVTIEVKDAEKPRKTSFYKLDENSYTVIVDGLEKTQYTVPASYVSSMKKETKDFTD